jgi:hypothetical protein
LSAALVVAQSMPPCFRHTSPVRGALDPSLQTTVSADVLLVLPVLLLSPAAGPVCTPGLARSAVSEGAPWYPAAPVSACPVGWLRCSVSAP